MFVSENTNVWAASHLRFSVHWMPCDYASKTRDGVISILAILSIVCSIIGTIITKMVTQKDTQVVHKYYTTHRRQKICNSVEKFVNCIMTTDPMTIRTHTCLMLFHFFFFTISTSFSCVGVFL